MRRMHTYSWKNIKGFLPLYLLMFPGMLYFFINNYIPMTGIIVAFKKYNVSDGIYGSPWCGLDNFIFLFKSDAYTIMRNTLCYNVVFIIVNTFISLVLAILISDVASKYARKVYQSSILLPFLISMVIVSYIVYAFLGTENGLINKSILEPITGRGISWFQEKKYWPFILTFVNAWKGVGYSSLIYIAGIAGIDKSLIEAAMLDGASKWQQIKTITLPALVPSIITLTLLAIGRIFYSDFGLFYQIPQNSGALYPVTNTIDTYVYRAMITAGGMGRSSAACVFQSVIGFVLVVVSNLIIRKAGKENALF